MGEARVSFDVGFWPSVETLDAKYNARVIEALNLFNRNPEHPNLHLKPLRRELGGLYSARAGRDLRILMERRGDTYVWIEAGMRRDIYEKAERGRFVVSRSSGFMGFVEQATPEEQRRRPVSVANAHRLPGILDHWSTPELSSVGLSDNEIGRIRGLTDEYELLDLGLNDDRLDLIIEIMGSSPELYSSLHDPATAEQQLREAIAEFGSATGLSQLFTPDEVRRLISAPIEDWMVFLHPAQDEIVRASYRGPARVRGAAGTGKTVVALHRAAELSARHTAEGPTVFVTYAAVLVPVLVNLYQRLPQSASAPVDFRSVEALAVDVAAGLGLRPAEPDMVDVTFDEALEEVVAPGSPLAGLSASYLRAEIEAVIRGRGFEVVEDYLEAVRRGRKVGFTEAMRRQAWDLHEAWRLRLPPDELELNDLILRAARAAEFEAGPWRCAIVDEAQDLTMMGLELVRGLSSDERGADRPDGLLLCGDGAQKVRPGGYTLKQAGVEVRGRTTILRRNYRTTEHIVDAALAIAGTEEIVDLDESFRRGEQRPQSDRPGNEPTLFKCSDEALHIELIAERIRQLIADESVALGDVAVLTAASETAAVAAGLAALGLGVIPLSSYDGTTADEVKVGSWHEAKGLEFKAVVVTGCSEELFPSVGAADEWRDEREERRILELSHLFVAMTRARDELSLVSVGEPAPVIKLASDHLRIVET